MVTAAAVRVMEAGVPYPRPNERAVVRLWSNAHNLSEGLRAEDGSRFRVLYPGRPGGGAGPDFRDAVLQKESGETVRGDVEVHVEESGWRAHRHHVDPGYNGVVLHLVLHAAGRKATRQESGAGAPVVRLPEEARERDDGPLPEPFAALVGGEPLGEALDRAGDRRFMARSAGFRAELERADPDEAAYGAVMEALGYAANRRPFRELARLVPFGRTRVHAPRAGDDAAAGPGGDAGARGGVAASCGLRAFPPTQGGARPPTPDALDAIRHVADGRGEARQPPAQEADRRRPHPGRPPGAGADAWVGSRRRHAGAAL